MSVPIMPPVPLQQGPCTPATKQVKPVFCIECGQPIEAGHFSGVWCQTHWSPEKAKQIAETMAHCCNICGGNMPPMDAETKAPRLAHGPCLENWIRQLYREEA